jgi:hypothetical protein
MGILNMEAAEYIKKAVCKVEEVNELCKMFEEPDTFAANHDLPMSDEVHDRFSQLQAVRMEHNFNSEDPVSREVIHFANLVVIDGQYLAQFIDNPQDVANNLGYPLSSEAADRLQEMQLPELVEAEVMGSSFKIQVKTLLQVLIVVIDLWPDASPVNLTPLVVDRATIDKI